MSIKPLRVGAVLCTRGSVAELVDQARRAAASGCDVVLLPITLGTAHPSHRAGDKMLAMAAEHADIVSILTDGTESHLAQRVQYLKERAGARVDQLRMQRELGISYFTFADGPRYALRWNMLRRNVSAGISR
jgi:hypothetical protein